MRSEEELLYRIPAKTPRHLLERLSEMARRREEGEDLLLPRLVLHLPGGRDLTGSVVRLEDVPPQGEVLLFHIQVDPRQPQFHLAYLDPAQIQAITVLDADREAHWLGFGIIPAVEPKTPAPGKLELARQLTELSQSLGTESSWTLAADIVQDGIPATDAARRNLQELIRQAMRVLRDLTTDSLALEALKEKVRQVRFAQAPQPGALLSSGVLTIQADLSKGYDGRLRPSELRAALSKLL